MAEPTDWREPHRDVKRTADGVNRADLRLRSFGRREGEAVMCPRCDGDGLILANRSYHGDRMTLQPVKCPTCGGEGLDPRAEQGV